MFSVFKMLYTNKTPTYYTLCGNENGTLFDSFTELTHEKYWANYNKASPTYSQGITNVDRCENQR